MDLLQKAIEQPECTDLFIGLVDIDYFKQINDNYGHRLSQLRFSCGVIHYLNNLSNVDQLYQKAD
ncbi:signal transduction diguanylate cyclase [Lactobacillus delbrueckii subsp. jakobsenii ZN7a-9 = DSM 26046]|nr:signal transduction diguanylate cyclase [Lactobacillus delbrueckii subsp. jakobsenii ZN7a-9 = DSM 26046]